MADKNSKADALKDSQKRAEQDYKDAEARQSGQPTPTQEENDRAKLGHDSLADLDDKEADGSPAEKDVAAGGAAAYNTRNLTPKK